MKEEICHDRSKEPVFNSQVTLENKRRTRVGNPAKLTNKRVCIAHGIWAIGNHEKVGRVPWIELINPGGGRR
jgi:hypothetical protein